MKGCGDIEKSIGAFSSTKIKFTLFFVTFSSFIVTFLLAALRP
jgi:hypothetical protein